MPIQFTLTVHLLRQPGQVSDDDECPRANESRQAHGEQNPQELNLFGVQVEAPPALFVFQTGAFANWQHSATLQSEEGGRGFRSKRALRPSLPTTRRLSSTP
jgi:hypothetical protein